MNLYKLLLCSAAVMTATGCRSDPVWVEKDYGNSVRSMVEAQIYDPQAAANPAAAAGGLDGAKGDKAIEAYRDPQVKPPRPRLSKGYSPL